ncbi:amino acid permease [Methanosarcina sp. KYL-1]|uniref:APC family permease n=1 Tax=Methanosarcina sp. KYL-1 TaxID=2602068 RepID=UPI0021014939|nr:APC family permease [Methanosarcina sp. KYL-1]MCQ1534408.1 amino acid permease [Methanosarcina sp. KYL-1]
MHIERHELKKTMGLFDYFTLGFGSMVGIGWVVCVGDWIGTAGGPLAAIIAFLIGGAILLPVTWTYGEMVSSMPVAGGEIAYTYRGFGPKASFYTGWILSFAYVFLCPWEAVAVGTIASSIFPGLKTMPLYEIMGFEVYFPLLMLELIVALSIAYINYKGVEKAAKFQSSITKLLILCGIAYAFAGVLLGDASNLQPYMGHSIEGFGTLGGIIAVLAITPFFVAGFDTIPQGAEESKSGISYHNLGKVLSITPLSGAIFYSTIIFVVALLMPWKSLINLEYPAADAIMGVAPFIGRLVLIGAVCGLLSTLNAFFVASTRLIFSMGRAKLIPTYFGKVDERCRTPKNAIIFVSIITIIAPFVGTAILIPVMSVGALSFMLAWLFVCLSAVRLRKIEPEMERPFKMPGGIKTGYLATLITALMVMMMVVPGSPGAINSVEWATFLAWMLLGVVFYYMATNERNSISEEEREYMIFGEKELDFAPKNPNSGKEPSSMRTDPISHMKEA